MLVMLSGFLGACTGEETTIKESPQSTAEEFLSLIDRGNYEESWKYTSTWLRGQVDSDDWTQQVRIFRHPLGTVFHRELISINMDTVIEDGAVRRLAAVIYECNFPANEKATEVVGLTWDDDSAWRVVAYQTIERDMGDRLIPN